MSLREAALRLAQRQLCIFPLVPRDKVPAIAGGCLAATTDLTTIETWWSANPDYNVGVATGRRSGVFVVDGDDEAALTRLEEQYGALPLTVESITARGRHVWLRHPPGRELRNSASRIAPGIDIRAEGGYVVAPPSVHPSGKRYCWSVDSASAFAEAPAWLLDLAAAPNGGNGVTPPDEWRELVRDGVAEGRRDCSVARLAGHLLRRRVDPFVVLDLLQSWNRDRCQPPLPAEDIERIVASIAGRELQRCGHDR